MYLTAYLPNLSVLYVDGKGEGFGNKISIQTVDIVQAAKATGRVYKVDDGKPVSQVPSRSLFFFLLHPSNPITPDFDQGENNYQLQL